MEMKVFQKKNNYFPIYFEKFYGYLSGLLLFKDQIIYANTSLISESKLMLNQVTLKMNL